jgi:hypothetical protein
MTHHSLEKNVDLVYNLEANNFLSHQMFDIKVGGTTTTPTGIGSSGGGQAFVHAPAYDYAPSVIRDHGIYKMYWCSGDAVEFSGDAIWYATSSNLTTWSAPQEVLHRTLNSQEMIYYPNGVNNPPVNYTADNLGHNCDPSVVKVNGTYYMYYTAGHPDINHQPIGDGGIFLATSTDGVNWTKYSGDGSGKPTRVISPKYPTNSYGAGQSSVFYLNGKFYHYYTDVSLGTQYGSTMLAVSYDGKRWFTENGGNPVIGTSSYIVTYNWKYNVFMGVYAKDGLQTQSIDVMFSHDGINWNWWDIQHITDLKLGSLTPAGVHNAGFLTDQLGVVSGAQTVRVFYGGGSTNQSEANTWEIYRTGLSFP